MERIKPAYLLLILHFALFCCVFRCARKFEKEPVAEAGYILKKDNNYQAIGTIIDPGEGITGYGHCWSKDANPVVSDNRTLFNTDFQKENFESNLSNLEYGETYYIKAFIINNDGIVYSNDQIRFTFYNPVSVSEVYQINEDSALVNLSVNTSDIEGVSNIGYCWSVNNPNPDVQNSNSVTFDNSNIISKLTSFITELSADEEYYVRSWSKRDSIYFYSETISFFAGEKICYHHFNNKQSLKDNTSYPPIAQTSYLIDDWEQAELLPAIYGTGLNINHDIQEGLKNDGANFFALNVEEAGILPCQGTIEFYFIFKYNSDISNYAYFFKTANELSDHFNYPNNHQALFFEAGWNSLELLNPGKYFFFTIGNSQTNRLVEIKAKSLYGETTNESVEFAENDTVLLSFVWDINGLFGTEETMQVYINKTKVASTKEKWNANAIIDKYLYLGAPPGSGYKDQDGNTVKGIFDEFKIYSFAKK